MCDVGFSFWVLSSGSYLRKVTLEAPYSLFPLFNFGFAGRHTVSHISALKVKRLCNIVCACKPSIEKGMMQIPSEIAAYWVATTWSRLGDNICNDAAPGVFWHNSRRRVSAKIGTVRAQLGHTVVRWE